MRIRRFSDGVATVESLDEPEEWSIRNQCMQKKRYVCKTENLEEIEPASKQLKLL